MRGHIADKSVDWTFKQAALGGADEVEFGFFGGEPLLNFPIIERIVLRARKEAERKGKDVFFHMNTNGILLRGKIAEFCRTHQFGLDISIDGDRETNDSFRVTGTGRGSYDLLGGHDRLAELLSDGLNIGINMVIHPQNVKRMSDNVKSFWNRGIHEIQILIAFDGTEDWTDETLRIFDSEFGKITHEALKKALDDGKTQYLGFNPLDKTVSAMLSTDDPQNADHMKNTPHCGVGRYQFSIDVDGGVYSCPRFVHDHRISKNRLRAGNVVDEVFDRKVIDEFKKWNPRIHRSCPCSTCEYSLYCIFQCLGHNLSVNGDSYKPCPFVCRFMSIVHKHASVVRDVLFPKKDDVLLKKACSE